MPVQTRKRTLSTNGVLPSLDLSPPPSSPTKRTRKTPTSSPVKSPSSPNASPAKRGRKTPAASPVKTSFSAGPTAVATTKDETLTLSLNPAGPPGPTTKLAFLLRAVNIHGVNQCNMKRLVQLATDSLGWGGVKTYVQSGNVIADVPASLPIAEAEERMRRLLEEEMQVRVAVLTRTLEQLERVIQSCPYDTTDPTKVHVFFLAQPPGEEAVQKLAEKPRREDEYTFVGGEAIILSYPRGMHAAALQGNVLERVLGVPATARNWRTVLAVRDLLKLEP